MKFKFVLFFLLNSMFCFTQSVQSKHVSGILKDVEGNTYKTIKIGHQVWMAENLRVKKFRNGDPILSTEATKDVSKEINPILQWSYNGDDSKVAMFGRLYTWNVVSDHRGVCPRGWHVPSDAQWSILINFLGGNEVAGGRLKNDTEDVWFSPNIDATNDVNFNALPAGCREYNGAFSYMNAMAGWWTATEDISKHAWSKVIRSDRSTIETVGNMKNYGRSIRCIQGILHTK